MLHVDVAVIGGGVVGLACACELARRGKSTLLLERHRALGTETSSRSSEVVHAGLYYPKGSLKAATCVRGAALLYAFCAERGVPHARVGKLVVAAQGEEEALEALIERATQNGAAVERVSAARIAKIEPEVRAASGLLSPGTGIVDTHALVSALAGLATTAGATLARGRRVVAAEPRAEGFRLRCEGVAGDEDIDAAAVVNAAGLWADEVAALLGARFEQRFVKGSYFRVRRKIVRHLVYPMPPGDGSLGIHTTVDLQGDVRLGPDALPAASRTDYAVDEARRDVFVAAAQRYLPGLVPDDLAPDTCGIRPKVASGDFVIERRGAAVHLVGIESPGLTASLAIAERVAMLMA